MDVGSGQWLHRMRRASGAAAIGGMTAVAILLALPATASAEPCDGTSCVEHLNTDAVQGAPCRPVRLYAFGLDASGNTLICYATYRNFSSATWVPLPPLIGVRDFGALCEPGRTAQSLDGLPLVCRDEVWQKYTPALPVS